MKLCNQCNIEKDNLKFNKNKNNKDGLSYYCKECCYKKDRNYYLKNHKKLKEYQKKYFKHNKKKVFKMRRKYYLKNKLKIKQKHQKFYSILKNKENSTLMKKKWRLKNIDKVLKLNRKREKLRRKNDPCFKISQNLRCRMRYAIKYGYKSDKSFNLIGCNPQFLKEYLEKLFLPGMNWENYGVYGWHIDHIKPCCTFDLTKPEEQEKCFHYTNLRPLWATNTSARNFGDFETIGNCNRQKSINTKKEYEEDL